MDKDDEIILLLHEIAALLNKLVWCNNAISPNESDEADTRYLHHLAQAARLREQLGQQAAQVAKEVASDGN